MIKNCMNYIFNKYLYIFVFCCLFIILFSSSSSFCVYEGDDTYTDSNNTIKIAYDSILNDFIMRLSLSSDSNYINQIKNYIKGGQYNYYVYYGSSDGSTMFGSAFQTRNLYLLLWNNSNTSFTMTGYNTYQGMTCDIYQLTTDNNTLLYGFSGNSIIALSTLSSYYVPSPLISYHSSIVNDFLNDNSSSQFASVVESIESTSQQTQNVIAESSQQTQNVITNSTVEDDSMSIDTDDMQVEDTEGVYNFFTSFLNTMENTFSGVDSSVSTISVPLGFVDSSIVLRSDVISSVISGTYIETLVELFWYFVFGTYYIILTKRILDYLSTGQIAVGGVTGFIKFLDGQNQIIKTYMM